MWLKKQVVKYFFFYCGDRSHHNLCVTELICTFVTPCVLFSLQWWMVILRVCASCWMNRIIQTSWMLLTVRDSEWPSLPPPHILFASCDLSLSVFPLKYVVLVCRTPLMLAVAGGHVDAVSLLLEREANVNVADNHGLTALHLGVSAELVFVWI